MIIVNRDFLISSIKVARDAVKALDLDAVATSDEQRMLEWDGDLEVFADLLEKVDSETLILTSILLDSKSRPVISLGKTEEDEE